MKVLIDGTTTQDEKSDHGIGKYTQYIIESLIVEFPSMHFKVMLFDSPSTLDGFMDGKHVNAEIIRIGKWRSNNYLNRYWFKTQFEPVIKQLSKNHIYFSPYFWRGLPGVDVSTVTAVHDMALPEFNIYSEQSSIHNFIRKLQYWAEMKRVTQAKAVFVPSNYTKESMLSYLSGLDAAKAVVIPLGLNMLERETDIDHLLPKDWRVRGYFVYLGGSPFANKNSIGVIQGYFEFIKSMGHGANNDLPYLVIAGGAFSHVNDSNVRLRDEISRLGLEKFVYFTGRYEDDQKYSLLKSSMGFIHLSLFEGFGIALAEAMRAKVPVIVHNGTSYPEVVDEAGLLVNGKDSMEVGQAMKWLYNNHDGSEVKKLVATAYNRSLQFEWKKSARKVMDTMKTVWEEEFK